MDVKCHWLPRVKESEQGAKGVGGKDSEQGAKGVGGKDSEQEANGVGGHWGMKEN